ncbi:Suppressor of Sensor Kinase (SLN1) [Mortierella alpina]|uniref:Suppressor of Sensor Kinase (SLN1) n=1 Tax=Mortierella alpina TaxID=64518 RepID=A0A9P6M3S0_MORAP|nr:Suppressor of Sensor Kinase (SLN1) [Mortierella alpina]
MSNSRVQEGEDEDAISVARPTSYQRIPDRASARNSLNMTWPLRPTADEHRASNSSSPSSFGVNQTIAVPIVSRVGVNHQQHSEPEAVVEPKKGVRFFFAEEVDDPPQDDSDGESDDDDEEGDQGDDDDELDNDDGADLDDDDDNYDDSEQRAAIEAEVEAEADQEVMRSMDSVRFGFESLSTEEPPLVTDPVDQYYDNHGENEEADDDDTQQVNESNKKDQERLDRFMQPTSNSDEGVLELNRERIDWQSMLQSVLTGEVFSIENKRLEDPNFEIQPAIKQQIWYGLRATLHSRPVGEEQRFVETARAQVDSFLQDIMDFKVDPSSPLSPLDQVLDALHKVDIVESLYPKTSVIGEEKPLYSSVKFQYRLDALNAYASVMKKMKIQTKILRNWTGSETLEVSRSKDAGQDEVSFVDRLLKENGLERTFEKSTLSSLHQAMQQIKKTMVENAVAFASMGLVPAMSELQQLIRFPTTLMQECLRLRLEYADRVSVPTLLNVDQMLEDFKTSLFLACKIKYNYEELESSENGWYLEPCIDAEYEKILKSSLQFYFKLLSWKVEYWGQSKKYTDSVLDLEWEALSELGQQIDGIGLDTAEQLCFLTSKLTTFLYKQLQEQMKERPDLPQTAGEVTKFYGKVLENVRFRANRLRRFARTLTDTFENSAEYLLDKKKSDSFGILMNRLAETNHVLVYTNTIEREGVYMVVEHKVAENALYLPLTLRSCFEQPGTGYILVFTPRERFVWTGPIIQLDGLPGYELDVKPGRVRLISERGSLLDACKKRFSKFAEPFGLEIITESRANVMALNKELNRTKKAAYKLADTIVQSVTVLRKVTMRVPNCQDLVQPFFRFAADYGLMSLSSMEGLPRSQFNLKLVRLSIDWVSFVCDDCDQTERQTFRWAMAALNFAMKMTKGNNILALSDSEFSWLRSKIAGCMTLLISHFDIHGARSQSETLRNERDGRSKQKPKDQARILDEISTILKLATSNESVLSEEAARNHRQQVEKLHILEKGRTEREQEIKVIGKVLDDQKPEDRSLVFLAALTDSVAIRWQMAKFIGAGTFGTVYLGTNSDTGELIAVKEIRFQNASMNLVKSIHDEMKVMKMLHHPNIVRYDNIEVHRHKVFIFMEFCQGGSLADLLEHGRIEDEKVIKVYTLQMLKGLAYLHDKNVVHRDVKPDNVLLDHLGNIKFVDFGAAKILAKNQRTRTHGRSTAESINVGVGANSLNGTPMYMAPEVIKNGEKGRKGSMDIWSLGCCVLEMATGRRPWAHLDNEWAVMFHVATTHPPLPDPSQMSLKGIAFLKRCFTRSSRDRPSAKELLRDVWLRGVDTEESSEEYEYDEPVPEVNSDGEIVNRTIPYDVQEGLPSDALEGEEGDAVQDSAPQNAKVDDRDGHEPSSELTAEHIEELNEENQDAGHGRSAFYISKETLEANKFSHEQATSPGCESIMSDTVSEVGSEVGLMLSAVREREEGSRQVSIENSPIPGVATAVFPPADLGTNEELDQQSPTATEGQQHVPPLVTSGLSSSAVTPGVGSILEDVGGGFAREMGLDLSDGLSTRVRDNKNLTSPILRLSLMEKSGGDLKASDSAIAATAAVLNEDRRKLGASSQDLEAVFEEE